MTKLIRNVLLFAVAAVLVFALLIQLIPYGRDHSNPPVVSDPPWPSLQTRALAQRACFDCHSNETVWPWYGSFAPVSWLLYRDVTEGRQHLNFSDWSRAAGQQVDELQEVYEENSMPPAPYLLMHPAARLAPAERKQLFDGLAVLAASYRR